MSESRYSPQSAGPRSWVWWLVSAALVAGCSSPRPAPRPPAQPYVQGPHPVVSGFIVDPVSGKGACGIRVANPTSAPLDLAGYSLTSEFGSRSREVRPRGSGGRRDLVFPSGEPKTVVPPGGEIWVARDAKVFHREFGFLPDFEVGDDDQLPDDDPGVPDMIYSGPTRGRLGSWLALPPKGAGVLALMAPEGEPMPVVDVVPYNTQTWSRYDPRQPSRVKLKAYERKLGLPRGTLWKGRPVALARNLFLPSPPFSAAGRVIARDRDSLGRLLPDTNTAADWDAGSSHTGLGETPVHRVWVAGQSEFVAMPHREVARVVMTASPESNYAGVLEAFEAAKESIKVSIYYFKQIEIAEALVKAIERGVDVTIYMEGSVVGIRNGFSDQERYIAKMIEDAGRERSGNVSHGLGRAFWIRSDTKAKINDRYTYDHSKYVIIDDRWIIVGSENYGSTGHSVDNSHGNRGWEIQLATTEGAAPLGVVQDLLAVWNDDLDPLNHIDIVRYTDDPATLDEEGRGRYGPPPRGFEPHYGPKYSHYVPMEPSKEEFVGEVGMELVVSPDTSLDENNGILGAIARAQEEILVEHLSLYTHWGGKAHGSVAETPNLLLQALVDAARRGVKVRILLNCRSFGCDRLDAKWEGSTIDNDDVYELVNGIARREGLDMEARLLDMTSDDWFDDREDHGTAKIHNKGLIIDRRTTLFASINGVENSFKGNREVGVLVTSPRVAKFYSRLFWYDWTTVMEPRDVRVVPALAAASDDLHASVVVRGLEPGVTYYFRVSALDSDSSDVETTSPPTRLWPHESVLSPEVSATPGPDGVVALTWLRNRSECVEGDLAGYKVYYGKRSVPGTVLPAGARVYDGRGAQQGNSPFLVPAHPDAPQCRALIERYRSHDPEILPGCQALVDRAGACFQESHGAFPELAVVLDRIAPPGSVPWQRTMAALARACSAPPFDSAKYWEQERDRCAKLQGCGEFWGCLRKVESWRHKELFPRRARKRHGRGRGKGRR